MRSSTKEAARLLVEDTRFWVVKPRVSASSVTGLGTLFSGSYLGVDVGKSNKARRHFVGLEVPPIVTADVPGTRYLLHSEEIGSLGVGSPVYYRRIEVGQVVSFSLDPRRRRRDAADIRQRPYDQYVTTNTRFWHASGVDVTLDATGIKVDTASVAAIIAGGIAFQAPPDQPPAEPAPRGRRSSIWSADRAVAMRPHRHRGAALRSFISQESLRGL